MAFSWLIIKKSSRPITRICCLEQPVMKSTLEQLTQVLFFSIILEVLNCLLKLDFFPTYIFLLLVIVPIHIILLFIGF